MGRQATALELHSPVSLRVTTDPEVAGEEPTLNEGDTEQVAPDPASAYLVERRRTVRRWWSGAKANKPEKIVGLALSGGGIRSATFSLGILQALAETDRLKSIDLMSTVSGGGYIGCFLRSLFFPNSLRGISPPKPSSPADDAKLQNEIAHHHAFGTATLKSGPGIAWVTAPDGKGKVCNPVWWLREHSRYLAPNGASDFATAASYLSRNWLGMLFVFATAVSALLSIMALISAGVSSVAGNWLSILDGFEVNGQVVRLSPFLVFGAALVILSLGVSTAYWLTAQMSLNEPRRGKAIRWFLTVLLWVALVAAASLFGLFRIANLPVLAEVAGWNTVAVISLEVLFGVLAMWITSRTVTGRELLTAELRSRLTDWQTTYNLWAIGLLSIGLIESLAAAFRQWIWTAEAPVAKLYGGVLYPATAYLIKKLADGSGGAVGGRIAAVIRRWAPAIALVAGILLYGALAVFLDALVLAAVWTGPAWSSAPDLASIGMLLLIIVPVTLLVGVSNGFINLSSLHNLYAAKLTRAYLGASNVDRLRSLEHGIDENHEGDYIQPRLHFELDLPAPIHIINATLNRTLDAGSQIVARDRKGVITCVEPRGVIIGNDRPEAIVRWTNNGREGVAEALSLGQWCAISGAAASTGMGRMTSLGYALALTFANLRLGYWWWVPRAKDVQDASAAMAQKVSRGLLNYASKALSTFFYLSNEMTARYSPLYDRQYLSDGGHFENTGAYALVRKGVQRIVVCDNGQDPDYHFADLENLIRKLRVDFGFETSALGGPGLKKFLGEIDCTRPELFVDVEADPQWKQTMRSGQGIAFALALQVDQKIESQGPLHMILIKPRQIPGLPEDVVGYGTANPTFPQQSTGDQFFDEAQWESYRKLGNVLMLTLLQACPKLLFEEGLSSAEPDPAPISEGARASRPSLS